ncbi:MAG: hypothetical protein RL385_351 [Pseudomonadota bacterium]|jgi:PhnB protein
MTTKSLNPYINFAGTAAEAIRFYERALSARADQIMHWGDLPGVDCGPTDTKRILHAQLSVGGGILMLSDAPPNVDLPPRTALQIALHFDSVEELEARFAALGEGGSVTMAPHDSFWGARFAMLTDRFGVRWMFICETPART